MKDSDWLKALADQIRAGTLPASHALTANRLDRIAEDLVRLWIIEAQRKF